MYSTFQLAFKYFHYYLTSFNAKGHGMHSPFVFNFIISVLNDKKAYPEYSIAEELRQQLLKDQTVLTIEDFGAGSVTRKSNQRTVASIAKSAAKTSKFGQLLFRMIRHYQPETILELGTSLGITASYLSLAKPDAQLTTMEGAIAIAEKARQNFKALKLLQGIPFGQNLSLIEGNFDQTLSATISKLPVLDFAFIDGNHRQEPTERYFKQLLPVTHNDSILIFDDIHWSRDMEQAWKTIKQNASVRCTIDLFFIGIVLFRQEFKEKQHFKIRF